MNTCWQWFGAVPERAGNDRGGPADRGPFWMIGLCADLAFTWPWGPCRQLLVNFLHWGHSLTFYLSANYLTFSTYHLLFFKWLEAHPHFDIFFFLQQVFILFTCEASFCHPTALTILSKKKINKKSYHQLHNGIKKWSSQSLISISNTSLVVWVGYCQRWISTLAWASVWSFTCGLLGKLHWPHLVWRGFYSF